MEGVIATPGSTTTFARSNRSEYFVDELARMQPTPGFMRLVRDRVLHARREMKSEATERIVEIER